MYLIKYAVGMCEDVLAKLACKTGQDWMELK